MNIPSFFDPSNRLYLSNQTFQKQRTKCFKVLYLLNVLSTFLAESFKKLKKAFTSLSRILLQNFMKRNIFVFNIGGIPERSCLCLELIRLWHKMAPGKLGVSMLIVPAMSWKNALMGSPNSNLSLLLPFIVSLSSIFFFPNSSNLLKEARDFTVSCNFLNSVANYVRTLK